MRYSSVISVESLKDSTRIQAIMRDFFKKKLACGDSLVIILAYDDGDHKYPIIVSRGVKDVWLNKAILRQFGIEPKHLVSQSLYASAIREIFEKYFSGTCPEDFCEELTKVLTSNKFELYD